MPWRIRTGGVVGDPLVVDGLVLAPCADNWVYAVDATSGRMRWKYQRGQEPALDFWPPRRIAVAGGMVYIGETSTQAGPGAVHAVDARTGSVVWRRSLDDGAAALDIAAVDGAVVVQCGSEIRCLEAADGRERWRFTDPPVPGLLWTAPVIADGTVACGGSVVAPHMVEELGWVVCVGLDDGVLRWVRSTSDHGFNLACHDGVLYGGTAGGHLWAFEIETGEQRWGKTFESRQTDPSAVLSVAVTTPVVTSEWIYVGCGNGYTYRIDRSTGDLLWRWESPARVEAIDHAGGVTFAGFFDGSVAAYPGIDGDFLWWQLGPIGRIQGMRYADGMLFVGGRRHLAAFEATTGRPPWPWLATTRRSVRERAQVQP